MVKISCLFVITLFYLNTIFSIKVLSIDFKTSEKQVQNQLAHILMQIESSNSTQLNLRELGKDIVNILKEIKTNQTYHEEIIRKLHSQCLEEELFRKSEIKDANKAFSAAGEILAKCQISLDSAKENLPKLEAANIEYRKLLNEKSKERASKDAKLFVLKDEFSKTVDYLKNFSDQIKNSSKSPLKDYTQITENLISHMIKLGKLKEFAPIYVELKNKAEPNLSKLSEMINNLKSYLASDEKELNLQHDKENKILDKLTENLQGVITQMTKNIERIKTQIISLRICVTKEKTIIFSASSKSDRNDKLKKLAAITCKDFAKNFITATNTRKQQLQIISEFTNIIRKRFGQFNPEVLKKLKNMTTKIKNYINNNEFNNYKDYIAVNKRGSAL